MSSKTNFSGSIQRFLKGDADPANLFGFNPSRAEMRDNAADRNRRASQIAAETNSDALRKAGGSTDAPTKQVKKLGSKTHFAALSPFIPHDPVSDIINVGTEAAKNKGSKSKAKKKLAAKNQRHADTALTTTNLNKTTRFSDVRVNRQSILGGARS